MADLEAYRMVIEGLREQAQACKVWIHRLTCLLSCHCNGAVMVWMCLCFSLPLLKVGFLSLKHQ